MQAVDNDVDDEKTSPPLHDQVVGVPLSVIFAEGEAIERVREQGHGTLSLEPPFHVSDQDAYLVLPDDIGTEIVDILRDGDLELLHEALRDGLLAIGSIGQSEEGPELTVEQAATPAKVLREDPAHASTVTIGGGGDPLDEINSLPHTQVTLMSALLDDEGLDRVLRRKEYVGRSWTVPAEAADRLQGVDPTYVWSRRHAGYVGVELALFQEDEELVALLRPVALVAG